MPISMMPVSMPMSTMMDSVEVVEDKISWEVETGVPEWTRDPAIHIIIVPWRWIIGDNRRAFGIIVIIDRTGFSVLRSGRGWTFSVPLWYFSNDG